MMFPPFRFFNENEGSTSLIFLTKAWKKERKGGGDWWVQQKVKRWKREGGERSGRPAHINAALWVSGPVIKFHTIWGSKWHVNYKWPILCFSVTVLNKRGVREIIRLYCAKRGRGGGAFQGGKKRTEKRGEKEGPGPTLARNSAFGDGLEQRHAQCATSTHIVFVYLGIK